MEKHDALNQKILGLKAWLPAVILADHFNHRPDMALSYSDHQKDNFQKDIAWILSFLAESIWAGQPALFKEFIVWLRTFLSSVNVPMKDVKESLELLKKRINESFTPEENEVINATLSPAIKMVMTNDEKMSILSMENELTSSAQQYLEALLRGRRSDAMELVMKEVKEGVRVRDIYLNIFPPVQYEIGRLWQTNQINVAQEHYCTGATQLVMSQLYPYLFTGEKKGRKMVTACVPGELHEMGARMVTDFFEMEGWDTYYLGANLPSEGVIRFIRDIQPLFLAISATMTFHVSAVDEMIKRIREAQGLPADLKIIVGGYPFKIADRLWERVGADGYAANALDAINLADRLWAA